jgi:hypothetical protein
VTSKLKPGKRKRTLAQAKRDINKWQKEFEKAWRDAGCPDRFEYDGQVHVTFFHEDEGK